MLWARISRILREMVKVESGDRIIDPTGRVLATTNPNPTVEPFIANQIGNSTQTNYEAFYNYPFSRNIQITPTIQVIQNAGNQSSNGTILTGTLRTVFSF